MSDSLKSRSATRSAIAQRLKTVLELYRSATFERLATTTTTTTTQEGLRSGELNPEEEPLSLRFEFVRAPMARLALTVLPWLTWMPR
jgi:hypothetical protein